MNCRMPQSSDQKSKDGKEFESFSTVVRTYGAKTAHYNL